MAPFKRRKNFYDRCQEIVDDLHQRISNGEFLSEDKCMELYGKYDYFAFLHQLRKENADVDYRTMTPALEWMYHSQYFKWLKSQERRNSISLIVAVVSAGAAWVAALFAGLS